jgi:urease accessory protein
MSTDPRLRLLQLADGLFPAGGYAHSFGLETYVQAGRVRDGAGAEAVLRAHLEGSAGPGDAVAVVAAVRLGRAGDLDGAAALDFEIDAMRPAAELREASRQMGRQTLRVAAALTGSPFLAAFARRVETDRAPCHHPLVFGLVGGVLGWTELDAAQAYLHANAVAIVSAAVRLIPLGQLEGQRVLWSVGELVTRLAREAAASDGAPWTFAPGLEIAAMQHARLDARLFRS